MEKMGQTPSWYLPVGVIAALVGMVFYPDHEAFGILWMIMGMGMVFK